MRCQYDSLRGFSLSREATVSIRIAMPPLHQSTKKVRKTGVDFRSGLGTTRSRFTYENVDPKTFQKVPFSHLDMVGVVGSSPIAPTRFGRKSSTWRRRQVLFCCRCSRSAQDSAERPCTTANSAPEHDALDFVVRPDPDEEEHTRRAQEGGRGVLLGWRPSAMLGQLRTSRVLAPTRNGCNARAARPETALNAATGTCRFR